MTAPYVYYSTDDQGQRARVIWPAARFSLDVGTNRGALNVCAWQDDGVAWAAMATGDRVQVWRASGGKPRRLGAVETREPVGNCSGSGRTLALATLASDGQAFRTSLTSVSLTSRKVRRWADVAVAPERLTLIAPDLAALTVSSGVTYVRPTGVALRARRLDDVAPLQDGRFIALYADGTARAVTRDQLLLYGHQP